MYWRFLAHYKAQKCVAGSGHGVEAHGGAGESSKWRGAALDAYLPQETKTDGDFWNTHGIWVMEEEKVKLERHR